MQADTGVSAELKHGIALAKALLQQCEAVLQADTGISATHAAVVHSNMHEPAVVCYGHAGEVKVFSLFASATYDDVCWHMLTYANVC